MPRTGIKKIKYQKQIWVPLEYKGLQIDTELRLDLLVEDVLCLELKSIAALLPIHEAILLTYMRMLEKPKGVLINFCCTNIFKEGQKTFVNELFAVLERE